MKRDRRHNAGLPTDPRSDQKAVFTRNIFEHLTKFSAKALGSQARRIREQLIESRSLQSANSKLGEDFLLADTLVQGAQNRIWRLGCRFGFDDRRNRPIGGRHRIGYAASYASDALVLSRQSMSRRAAAPVPPLQTREDWAKALRKAIPRRRGGPIFCTNLNAHPRRRGRGSESDHTKPRASSPLPGSHGSMQKTFRLLMPHERYQYDDRNGTPISHSSNPLPRPMWMSSASSASSPAEGQTLVGP